MTVYSYLNLAKPRFRWRFIPIWTWQSQDSDDGLFLPQIGEAKIQMTARGKPWTP